MAALRNPRYFVRALLAGLLLLAATPLFAQARAEPQGQAPAVLGHEVCAECHQALYDAIRHTAHWVIADPRTPAAAEGCERCHGPGEAHAMAEGATTGTHLIAYNKTALLSPEQQNAVCLSCHADAKLAQWPGSVHEHADVACASCHRVHQRDRVRDQGTQPEICLVCHQQQQSKLHQPYRHPVLEGKMACSACHAPHGSATAGELTRLSVNELCYSCHAEKRGPFLWEHPPASEDCLLCHDPHGGLHVGMLSKRQPHLCQACHQLIGARGSGAGTGTKQPHTRRALSFRDPADPWLDSEPAHFVLGENCMNCHIKVHGSNHPSGATLMR